MRTSTSFTSTVRSGHKEDAIEVPFSPLDKWSLPPQPIGPRRLGYPVQGTVQGVTFQSYIVSRSKRFWLLLDPALEEAAGIAVGSVVQVVLREPSNGA